MLGLTIEISKKLRIQGLGDLASVLTSVDEWRPTSLKSRLYSFGGYSQAPARALNMTVWATPVPYYLAGTSPRGPADADYHQQQETALGRQPSQQQQGAADGSDDFFGGDVRTSVRRHSLGSIPSAAQVHQKQVRSLRTFLAPMGRKTKQNGP